MFALIAVLTNCIIQAFLNRQRGMDKATRVFALSKPAIYLLMSASFAATWLVVLGGHTPVLFAGFVLLLWGVDILRDAPTRGELFPHSYKDTSHEKYAPFIKTLATLTYGHKYTSEWHYQYQETKIVSWKTHAMCHYFTIFSVPRLVIISVFFAIVCNAYSPFFILSLALLPVCGLVYAYFFKRAQQYTDPVKSAEYVVGFYRALLDGIALLLSMLLLT